MNVKPRKKQKLYNQIEVRNLLENRLYSNAEGYPVYIPIPYILKCRGMPCIYTYTLYTQQTFHSYHFKIKVENDKAFSIDYHDESNTRGRMLH